MAPPRHETRVRMWLRTTIRTITCGLPILVAPTAASAQSSESRLFLAITPSVGKVPARYIKACTFNDTDWSASIALNLGVRRSGFRFVGGIGRVHEAPLLSQSACALDVLPYPDGTHTILMYPYRVGAYTFMEILAGREFHAGLDWHASVGGGYSFLPRAPHGSGVVGFRWGDVVQVGLDAELRLQRLTNDRVTSHWEDGRPVEVLSRTRISEWLVTAGLRAAVGIGIGF